MNFNYFFYSQNRRVLFNSLFHWILINSILSSLFQKELQVSNINCMITDYLPILIIHPMDLHISLLSNQAYYKMKKLL